MSEMLYARQSVVDTSIVRLLAGWYRRQSLPPLRPLYQPYLGEAIQKDSSLEVLTIILTLPVSLKSKEHRIGWNNFTTACFHNRTTHIKLFIEIDLIDVNDKTVKIPPLVKAVRSGPLSVVQVLVEAGADINATYQYPQRKMSALCLAADKGNVQMTKYLLDAGAVLPDTPKWPAYKATYDLLREAKMNEGGSVVPAFDKTIKRKLRQPNSPISWSSRRSGIGGG